MRNDLPLIGFDHTLRSDVIMTSVFFNNLRQNRLMVNHSALCRSIKYDNMNILTWTILKKTQILNGCETFAFKYNKWEQYPPKLFIY